MSIKSDIILFGDAIESRSYLHTFTNTDYYTVISLEDYNDGKNSYIVYMHVQDNKNSVSWCRGYLTTTFYEDSAARKVTELFTLGDTPVINIIYSRFGAFYPDSSPSPSNVVVEFRVSKLITTSDVLL